MSTRWRFSDVSRSARTPKKFATMCNTVSTRNMAHTAVAVSTPLALLSDGSRPRARRTPRMMPTRVTAVSWADSLAATSALLPRSAMCAVIDALVDPAATPHIALHTVAKLATGRTKSAARWGDSMSRSSPTSLIKSAKSRHSLRKLSKLPPHQYPKNKLPSIPAPSRSTHVIAAARAEADSFPTPTLTSTALVLNIPRR
mmetsp:Transcript_4502/g.13489  ORF Transcript_4502/g.13489 Transcript_4502/m.13489 type:complete len:200 (-) Transcript_4502:131-730(-)